MSGSSDGLMIVSWSVASMLGLLYSNMPWSEGPGKMRWSLRSTELFDVQSYYGVLQAPMVIAFQLRGIWCAKTLKRVSFFLWTAAWGKILTNDNLRNRGSTLVN